LHIGNLQQQVQQQADSGSVDDFLAGAFSEAEQVKSCWALDDAANLSTAEKVKKRLQNTPWKTLLPVLVLLVVTVVPYMTLVFEVLAKVITEERTGTCQRDLKLPLVGWVVTEFAFWGFLIAFSCCTCLEHSESIKKLGGLAIGFARLFTWIMGVIATVNSHRRDCNNTLYDFSMFLFVSAPITIVVLLCCAPLLTYGCVLVPSLRSATTAEQQIAERSP